jgi:hypothetical protein
LDVIGDLDIAYWIGGISECLAVDKEWIGLRTPEFLN